MRKFTFDGEAYRVVEALVASSGKLVREFPLLTQTSRADPESGFFYELHPGAAKFYRKQKEPGISPTGLLSACATSLSIFAAFQLFGKALRARRFRNQLLSAQTSPRNIDQVVVMSHAREAYIRRKISKEDFELLKRLCSRNLRK